MSSNQGNWFGWEENNNESKKSETPSNDGVLDLWQDQGSKENPTDLLGFNNPKKPNSKKKKIIQIGVSALAVVVIGTVVTITVFGDKELPKEQTAQYELNNVNSDITSANVENLTQYVTNSYLAQEWDYFNDVTVREQFYQKVMATVNIEPVEKETAVTDTSVTVNIQHVDWVKVINDMRDFDFEKIQNMYKDRLVKKSNYEFDRDMENLFSDYIVSLEELPVTKTENIAIPMKSTKTDKVYSWNVTDDSEIDQILFSSKEFHEALDVFGGIATGDIGKLKRNPNWTEWDKMVKDLEKQLEKEKKNLEEYNKVTTNGDGTVLYKDEDGEVISVINLNQMEDLKESNEEESKETSTRPTKVTDKDGKEVEQEESYTIDSPVADDRETNIVNAIENQLKIMKANEPLKTYIEGEKEIKDGSLVQYDWVGAYYLQNEYTVNGKPVVVEPEEGDGSFEKPLGFNTPFVTKMKASDNTYHDVRVTFTKILEGQEAIDYAIKFDERNRGFDTTSDNTLVAIEFTVKNLEKKDLILDSEFTLSDSNANLISRTGSMYNFAERTKIKAGKTAVMQDWFYTPNVESKYLIWGETFKRKYPELWIKILAGENTEGKEKPVSEE